MKIIPNPAFTHDISKFKQLLSLDDSKNIFKFENNFLNEDTETIAIKNQVSPWYFILPITCCRSS